MRSCRFDDCNETRGDYSEMFAHYFFEHPEKEIVMAEQDSSTYSARYCDICESRCARKGNKFICPVHGATNTFAKV